MKYLGRCEVVKIDKPYVIFGKPKSALIEDDEKVFKERQIVPENQVLNRSFIEIGNLGNIYKNVDWHRVTMDPQHDYERALGKKEEQIKFKPFLLD